MYDLQHARRPQAAAGRLLIYDGRGTIWIIARVARRGVWTKAQPLPRQGRTGRVEADGVCLCATYDLRSLRAVRRGTLVVMIFDAYKHGYQSIRVFPLLIDFPQMRLPCRVSSSPGMGTEMRVDGMAWPSIMDI